MINLAKGGNRISYIFVFMIVFSIVCALLFGKSDEMSHSVITGANSATQLLITMSSMICLWSGVMEVASDAKLTEKIAGLFSPFLRKLFPDVKKDSKAFHYICMNISANLLGLSNAATPFGIEAMKELKKDSDSNEATDSMVTFVVMNTASLQLLPTTVATFRATLGSKSPFDIVTCVWVTSVLALLVGLIVNKLCITFGGKNGTCDAAEYWVYRAVRPDKRGECVRVVYKGSKKWDKNAV